MSIKLILFDLGNTLFYFSRDRSFRYWSEISKIPFELIKERYVNDQEHKDFEAGKISEEAYAKHLGKLIGFEELSFEDFFVGWNAIYMENLPHIQQVLDKLVENGYRIAALSNTNLSHEKVWKEKYQEMLSPFEKVFASHHMGHIKPEPEIYKKVIESVNLAPEEILFLDDMHENILGARTVGMHGIQILNPVQAYNAMVKVGVLEKSFLDRILY